MKFAPVIAFTLALVAHPGSASEGTVDRPIRLDVPSGGAVLARQGRVDGSAPGAFYAFTLARWSDLELRFPQASDRMTIWLMRGDEMLLDLFAYDPRRDGPVRLTTGPGEYAIFLQRPFGSDAMDYTLELTAPPARPRGKERAGDLIEDALDIGALDRGVSRLAERTAAGGGFFHHRFEIAAPAELRLEIDAEAGPASLVLRDGQLSHLASAETDAGSPAALTAFLRPGAYYVRTGVRRGQTDFGLTISARPAEPVDAALRSGAGAEDATSLGALTAGGLWARGLVRVADNPVNWYAFSLDRAARVEVAIDRRGEGEVLVQVVDPAVGLPDGVAMPRPPYDPDVIAFDLEAGRHLLRVVASEGAVDYGLNLRPVHFK